jgi:integrase
MSDQQSLFEQNLSPKDRLSGDTFQENRTFQESNQQSTLESDPPQEKHSEEKSGKNSDDLASRKKELTEGANQLLRQYLAESTRQTYASGWNDFASFCAGLDLVPLPADQDTVAMYMTERHGQHAPSTIETRLSAIGFVHDQADEEDPTDTEEIRKLMKSIRRNSDHTPKQAPPLLTYHIRRMVNALRETQDTGEGADTPKEKADRLRALQDETIVLFGFASALRCSELAQLSVGHLTERPKGLFITIPESKTDQEGRGEDVPVRRLEDSDYCPVRTLQRWRSAASIEKGPIFRGVHWRGTILDGPISTATVNNAVGRAVRAAQLSNPDRFTSHSLRAGHITQANQEDVPDAVIKAQTRHDSDEVFRQYVRPEKNLDNSSSAHLDL